MFISLRKLITYAFLLFSFNAFAEQLPQVRVAVLQSGTVNWELQHLKNQSYDRQFGFDLQINKVASLSAARLALTSDSVDIIVSDWLWAGKRNADGAQLRFIPFSSQIGSVIVKPEQTIKTLAELKGKNIGVAGGPLNKGWVLLRTAAKDAGVDLEKEAKVQYGAPPLLSQALKRGQVDVLVTFWHYGARLEAEGYQRWLSLEGLMSDLGMKSKVPMLGYILKAGFANQNSVAVEGFTKAIQQTKNDLAENDTYWNGLRHLMKAENDEIYQALIKGYRNGTPKSVDTDQISDAVRFFELIDQLSSYPSGNQLDPTLFRVVE
ncbi:MAG: ABC transporter substrate-binding protein [Neptuniibacter sp.]